MKTTYDPGRDFTIEPRSTNEVHRQQRCVLTKSVGIERHARKIQSDSYPVSAGGASIIGSVDVG